MKRTPSHLILKAGQFVEKQNTRIKVTEPIPIHYRHTIRMLPQPCNHQDLLQFQQRIYSEELEHKERQIRQLRQLLTQESQDLLSEDNEGFTVRLQGPQYDNYLMIPDGSKIQYSRIEPSNQSSMSLNINDSRLTQHNPMDFSTLIQSQHHLQIEDPQVQKVKEEMKSTLGVLANITSKLNQPRKKYQFYNTSLENKNIKEEYVGDKRLDETELFLNQNRHNETYSEERARGVNVGEKNTFGSLYEDNEESLDQTVEEQAKDTATFLQESVNQHQKLKQMLITLEESTQREFQEMRNYYQGEIQQYLGMLEDQKDKKVNPNLNSTRSNIDLLTEVRDQQICYEENDQPSISQKFQIIFPEEPFLTPDLLE